MLKNEQIVYLTVDYRADHRVSGHQVSAILSEQNTLLHVECAGMRPPVISSRDFSKIIRKVLGWFKGVRQINPHVFLYTLILIPFHQYRLIRKLNEWLICQTLRSVLKRLQFSNPILWIHSGPHGGVVAGKLNEKLTVYYVTDEYSEVPNVDVKSILSMEKALLQKADVVFVTSESLQESKRPLNPHVFYSPHGVDFDLFSKAIEKETAIPQEIADYAAPIVGFFGIIDHRFDLDLFEYVARNGPHLIFILIGRIADDIANLPKLAEIQKLSNVHFLGTRPHDLLPNYLKKFDVCINPAAMTSFTKYANPIKIREYLAAGKPTVSTPIPEMKTYKGLVEVALEPALFLEKINQVYRENSPEKVSQRREAVRPESWRARVEAISEIVERRLADV